MAASSFSPDSSHSFSFADTNPPAYAGSVILSGGAAAVEASSVSLSLQSSRVPYNNIMLTRPARLIKLEDSILFLGILLLYSHLHLSWLLFAMLFLAPDLSMLGYLISPL